MNRFPSKDSFFEVWVTPAGERELSFRLAVSKEQVTIAGLPQKGQTYAQAAPRLVNTPHMDKYAGHVLSRFENGPDGWLILWFVTPKAEDQDEIEPYFDEYTETQVFEWPAVLYEVNVAVEEQRRTPAYTLKADGSWEKGTTALELPRRVIKRPQFGAWRVRTTRWLKPTPFVIPPHPQPDPQEVEYVVNGKPERLVALHKELLMPSGGQTWNVALSQSITQQTAMPGNLRRFPSTKMTDWRPFVVSDRQRELEDGSWEREVKEMEPPLSGELMEI